MCLGLMPSEPQSLPLCTVPHHAVSPQLPLPLTHETSKPHPATTADTAWASSTPRAHTPCHPILPPPCDPLPMFPFPCQCYCIGSTHLSPGTGGKLTKAPQAMLPCPRDRSHHCRSNRGTGSQVVAGGLRINPLKAGCTCRLQIVQL